LRVGVGDRVDVEMPARIQRYRHRATAGQDRAHLV